MLRQWSWLALGLAALGACVGAASAYAEEKPAPPAAQPAPAITPRKLELKIVVPPALAGPKADETKPASPPDQPAETPKAPPIPTEWPAAEILAEEAKCKTLLKSAEILAIPVPPFRTGSCGAPAAVRLISVGKNPEVALDPPPLVTCELAANLAHWIKTDVQPLAQKHLGERVIKIATMSDYSCRAAYGRKGNRLSEHGRANALDIRGFTLSKGKFSSVLAEWGMTQRDVARAIAAAKAAAEKAEKERAAAAAPQNAKPVASAPATPSASSTGTAPTGSLTDRVIVDGMEKPAHDQPGAARTGTSLAPDHLGGPKEKSDTAALPQAAIPVPQILSKAGLFLREVHASACRLFGTTLGPEANESHRNHFHVDMATRTGGLKICD